MNLLLFALALAQDGGQVVGGGATITNPDGSTTRIDQFTDKAIIDWRDFSIDAGHVVTFNQPSAASVALNRVTGGNPSSILGTLQANGQIFLLNPNGIVFGAGSRIDVGGFLASTLALSNEDFLAGNYHLLQDPSLPGSYVINEGVINANWAALVAPLVENRGIINAPAGSIYLAGASEALLSVSGNGLLSLSIGDVAGGTVHIREEALSDVVRAVVNHDGLIEAGAVIEENGVIKLVGAGGTAVNSGALAGGTVTVEGAQAAVTTKASTIEGDRVSVLGDNTYFDGKVTAPGGFVEVSGYEHVWLRGKVDTKAPGGVRGTFLIDPPFLTIIGGAGPGDWDGTSTIGALDPSVGADTISQGYLEGLSATTDIDLAAEFGITIDTLNGGVLNLQTGAGNFFRLTTTDPTGPGIRFTTATDTIRTAGGSIELNSASAIVGGRFDTTGALMLTAGSYINASNAVWNAGTIAVDVGTDLVDPGAYAIGSDVNYLQLDNAVLTATGGVTLFAGADYTIGTVPTDTLDVNAWINYIDLSNTVINAGGNVTATAGGNLYSTGPLSVNAPVNRLFIDGMSVTSGGFVAMLATGNFTSAESVSVYSGSNQVSFIGGSIAANGGSANVNAGGNISGDQSSYLNEYFNYVTIQNSDLTSTGDTTVSTFGDISSSVGDSTVDFSAWFGYVEIYNFSTITAGGNVNVYATGNSSGSTTLDLNAGRNYIYVSDTTLDSTGGSIDFNASGPMWTGSGSINQSSNANWVDINNSTLTATMNVTLTGAAWIASGSSLDVNTQMNRVYLSNSDVTATTGWISLSAGAGNSFSASGADLSIWDSVNTIYSDGTDFTAGAGITLSASGHMNAGAGLYVNNRVNTVEFFNTTMTNDAGTGGFTLNASGNFYGPTANELNDYVNFIRLNFVDLTAGANIDIATSGYFESSAWYFNDNGSGWANYMEIQFATLDAGSNMTISATGDVWAADSVNLDAGHNYIYFSNNTVTTGGNLTINAGGTYTATGNFYSNGYISYLDLYNSTFTVGGNAAFQATSYPNAGLALELTESSNRLYSDTNSVSAIGSILLQVYGTSTSGAGDLTVGDFGQTRVNVIESYASDYVAGTDLTISVAEGDFTSGAGLNFTNFASDTWINQVRYDSTTVINTAAAGDLEISAFGDFNAAAGTMVSDAYANYVYAFDVDLQAGGDLTIEAGGFVNVGYYDGNSGNGWVNWVDSFSGSTLDAAGSMTLAVSGDVTSLSGDIDNFGGLNYLSPYDFTATAGLNLTLSATGAFNASGTLNNSGYINAIYSGNNTFYDALAGDITVTAGGPVTAGVDIFHDQDLNVIFSSFDAFTAGGSVTFTASGDLTAANNLDIFNYTNAVSLSSTTVSAGMDVTLSADGLFAGTLSLNDDFSEVDLLGATSITGANSVTIDVGQQFRLVSAVTGGELTFYAPSITIVNGGAMGFNQIAETYLEGLASTTTVYIEADDAVTLNDLADDTLGLALGAGELFSLATFNAAGAGIAYVSQGDTISTANAGLEFESASTIFLGGVNPGSGSLTVAALDLTIIDGAAMGVNELSESWLQGIGPDVDMLFIGADFVQINNLADDELLLQTALGSSFTLRTTNAAGTGIYFMDTVNDVIRTNCGAINLESAADLVLGNIDPGCGDVTFTGADLTIIDAASPPGPNRIYETALEAIGFDSNITVRGTNSITVEDLVDGTLGLATGAGYSFTLRTTNAAGGGIFFNDRSNNVTTGGGAVEIRSAFDLEVPIIDTMGGDITVGGRALTIVDAGTAAGVNQINEVWLEGHSFGVNFRLETEASLGVDLLTTDGVLSLQTAAGETFTFAQTGVMSTLTWMDGAGNMLSTNDGDLAFEIADGTVNGRYDVGAGAITFDGGNDIFLDNVSFTAGGDIFLTVGSDSLFAGDLTIATASGGTNRLRTSGGTYQAGGSIFIDVGGDLESTGGVLTVNDVFNTMIGNGTTLEALAGEVSIVVGGNLSGANGVQINNYGNYFEYNNGWMYGPTGISIVAGGDVTSSAGWINDGSGYVNYGYLSGSFLESTGGDINFIVGGTFTAQTTLSTSPYANSGEIRSGSTLTSTLGSVNVAVGGDFTAVAGDLGLDLALHLQIDSSDILAPVGDVSIDLFGAVTSGGDMDVNSRVNYLYMNNGSGYSIAAGGDLTITYGSDFDAGGHLSATSDYANTAFIYDYTFTAGNTATIALAGSMTAGDYLDTYYTSQLYFSNATATADGDLTVAIDHRFTSTGLYAYVAQDDYANWLYVDNSIFTSNLGDLTVAANGDVTAQTDADLYYGLNRIESISSSFNAPAGAVTFSATGTFATVAGGIWIEDYTNYIYLSSSPLVRSLNTTTVIADTVVNSAGFYNQWYSPSVLYLSGSNFDAGADLILSASGSYTAAGDIDISSQGTYVYSSGSNFTVGGDFTATASGDFTAGNEVFINGTSNYVDLNDTSNVTGAMTLTAMGTFTGGVGVNGVQSTDYVSLQGTPTVGTALTIDASAAMAAPAIGYGGNIAYVIGNPVLNADTVSVTADWINWGGGSVNAATRADFTADNNADGIGGVSVSSTVTAPDLVAYAADWINFTDLQNVGRFQATNSTSGDIFVQQTAGDLTLADIDGLGYSVFNGAPAGLLTFNNTAGSILGDGSPLNVQSLNTAAFTAFGTIGDGTTPVEVDIAGTLDVTAMGVGADGVSIHVCGPTGLFNNLGAPGLVMYEPICGVFASTSTPTTSTRTTTFNEDANESRGVETDDPLFFDPFARGRGHDTLPSAFKILIDERRGRRNP